VIRVAKRPDRSEQFPRREPPDVLRAILELIGRRGLTVGDRLPAIRELAAELGVKPTIVRDAVLRAQTMGLLRVLPRSGAFIQSLSYAPLVDALASTLLPALSHGDHNLFHLLDARRVLEIELAGRAAEHRRLEDLLPVRRVLEGMSTAAADVPRGDYVELDVRFHVEIARLAGNGVLLTMQQALLDLLRPHLVQLPWTPERRGSTDGSHAAIYSALAAGDADAARAAMRDHLSLAYDSMLCDMRTAPGRAPNTHGPGNTHGPAIAVASASAQVIA
jgi:GntR family transcriptional repressor for pyruvate dehydrogenase complex